VKSKLEEKQTESKQNERMIYLLILFGIILLGSLVFGICASRFMFPLNLGDYYESFIWSPARVAIAGQNPYAYSISPPYIMAPYGYVYYLFIGVGVKLFGLQLWFGRLLSIVSVLVCLWSVKQISFSITKDKQASLIALLSCIALYPVQLNFCVQRPDFTAFAFALLALQIAYNDDEGRRKFFVIICLALAFFCKHTITLPVFVAALLYWRKESRLNAIIVFLGTILLCGLGMYLLNITSQGGYVWQHFTHAGRLDFKIERVIENLLVMLKAPATLVLIAGIVITAFFARMKNLLSFNFSTIVKEGFTKEQVVVIHFLIACLLVLISTGRFGASINYYLEVSFTGSIVLSLSLHWLMQNHKTQLVQAILFLLILGGSFQMVRVIRGEYFRWKSLPYNQEIIETVNRLTPPESVCISVFPDLLTASGREFHFDDWLEYAVPWSPELNEIFKREVATGRYPAIIWHDSISEEKFQGYRLVRMKTPVPEKVHPVYLYVRDETK